MARPSLLARVGWLAVLVLLVGSTAAEWLGETRTENGVQYKCKCYDDNACWPTAGEWDAFNKTLGGALQLAIPAAVSCHYRFENYTFNTYDAAKCADATARIGNGISGGDEQWLFVLPYARRRPVESESLTVSGRTIPLRSSGRL